MTMNASSRVAQRLRPAAAASNSLSILALVAMLFGGQLFVRHRHRVHLFPDRGPVGREPTLTQEVNPGFQPASNVVVAFAFRN